MGWLLVMFDLPTDTPEERRSAAKFRANLLDEGYLMLQYSIYARCAVTLDKKEGLLRTLGKINPETGNVQCLFITDAQWGQSTILHASERKAKRAITKEDRIDDQLQFW
ncbi:MAG: CRISPR-associated endonuclease Cas2 [Elusimicrobiota bacterium]